MKKYILLLTLLWSTNVSAQQCSDILNNTTDPDNPSDYRGNTPSLNPFVNLDLNMVDAK